jgi:NAD(P)-dependent dehydrogenase (short-subunit alcohol dehydrogenase family)
VTSASELDTGTVVVTGAASGIGRAIVMAFAADRRVVAVDLDSKGLSELQQINAAVRPVVADVSRERDVAALFEIVEREDSPLRVICSAAGILARGTAESTSLEDWKRIMAVNMEGVFLCSKHGIPQIRAAGGGAIVNIASINAFMAEADIAAYCASKAAVVGFTRSTAMDHAADGIRVNAICPGLVDTPMARDYFSTYRPEDLAKANCLGRAARPEEIANVAVFLASSRASFMTGAAVCVDGGASAHLRPLDL